MAPPRNEVVSPFLPFGPSPRRAPATTTSADFSPRPLVAGVALSGARRDLPG